MQKNYNWNLGTCICENYKYPKGTADTSVIDCDEIIYVMDIVSTNITSTIPINESTNSGGKKVRYNIECYNLITFLLVIISLFIIAIFSTYCDTKKNKNEE